MILVEGKVDLRHIDKNIFNKDSLIICFDYDSHNSLLNNQIKHKLIEDYFTDEEIKELDELTLKFSTLWYKEKEIEKYLKYENLSLGYLLELEIPIYFLKVLKRIVGIKKIIDIEKPNEIISFSLKNYVEHICKDKEIKLINFGDNIPSGLHFDTMKIPFSFLFFKKNFRISRQNYFKIKNFIDVVSSLLLNSKLTKEEQKKGNNILLLDFSTKIYEDLLKKIQISDKNIVLLNQRKSVIWDLETLKILKNSNCKILSIYDFENKNVKKINKVKQTDLNKNLNRFIESKEELRKIFSHNGESFWEIIEKEFYMFISKRFSESIKRIILIEKLFENVNVECILDWAHTGTEEKEINHIANRHEIKIFCLQHGIMTLNPKFEKYHPLMPVLPSNNSKMLVWGKMMESYLLEHEISRNEIKIIGSPRHDKYFKSQLADGDNSILIASNLFFPYNFDGNDTRAYERFVNNLKKILEIIKQNSDKKPIIKLHQAEYFEIKSIINEIDPSIPIYQYEDSFELLKKCDFLISLNYSTIIVDALILNKPTLVVFSEKQNYEEELVIREGAVSTASDLYELENNLKKILSDINFRENLLSKGRIFVDEYFSNHGNSSNYLAKFLTDLK